MQTTAATAAPSSFIAKADAICAHFNMKRAPLQVRTSHDWERLLPQLAAYENTAYLGLSGLHSPPSLANDWRQIVGGVKLLVGDIVEVGRYAQANEVYSPGAKVIFDDFQRVRLRIRAIAARDGFSECSQL